MSYSDLLPAVVSAAERAGSTLLKYYSPTSRPADRKAMYEVGMQAEAASLAVVKAALDGVAPNVGWYDDDSGEPVPAGEWWIVDGAEGAVNLVHGLAEFGVVIVLIRDGEPQLAVARQPIGDLTYVAVRGGGAFLNGERLRVSSKQDLDAAIVAASQAGNGSETHERFGATWAALADRALLVRNTIPTTFPLLALASGQYDAFFQYEPDLPGAAAGTLLATEAGGVATDLAGEPWRPTSTDVLVAAPGLHRAVREVLS
ncbi:inositol monophosphatase family protein [Cryptosporangium arvum]|uniref:Inositol monophosphatase/fructose-1,6-bisphosphatase family protein n=1 Tax=Cryptosporangium arvum DSM 44712 TaxID=927661 RepID=A0A010YP10_9ACTN|nr:inositol monophosphatase family protein [Cryptosporangium arvum]EXG81915.1 inositol monophosphatase/fructose-1,6-bisphosphatase family protein [Cryptosporangium arvum DSM 44712]